ncbi:MAG: PDZ domain-containing protein, partial [Desulfobacterales bacterium]|nr:PDZ domain-containing protein [Desulfobacterales bacterium]
AKAQGIGFAIPINKAKRIISNLIRYGEVVDPWIGVDVQDIDTEVARYLGIKEQSGVLVKVVEKESPSKKAGIQEGDIILSVGKRRVHSSGEFRSAMRGFSAGDMITLHLLRNKKQETLSVKASIFPDNRAMNLAYQLLGTKVDNFTNKKGVVITEINRRSYLAGIGAVKGDIILRINEIPINNKNDFKKAIIKYRYKSSVIILLQRENQIYNITVKL